KRSADCVPAHRAPSMVVPAAGRQPHDPREDASLPAGSWHYQSMFSAAIRCSAPLARASAVAGLVVMPASGRHYQSKCEAQRRLRSGTQSSLDGSAGRWPATP
ncbi:hypothetical protein, partial [Stenotrophomonas maltophilia]|uniref:hypothetical protein n=1 Tax=Stenotrophomonas maltophilia TaxID=40324 RepID=UPI001E4DB4AC